MPEQLLANYHTHTARCHHATGTEEEYIQTDETGIFWTLCPALCEEISIVLCTKLCYTETGYLH